MLIIIFLALIISYLAFYNSVQTKKCIKVQTTCCSCNNGGEQKCVLITEKEKYEINKSKCPKDLICTALYNCNENPCVYKQGKCTFSSN